MKYHEDYELEMTEDEVKYHEHLKKMDLFLEKIANCSSFAKASNAPLNPFLDNFLNTFEADVNVDGDLTFVLSANGLIFHHDSKHCAKINIFMLEEWIFTLFNSIKFNNFNEYTLGVEFFNKFLEIFHLYSSILLEKFYCI